MFLVFFLFLRLSRSRDKDSLFLYHTCAASQYYDWFEYECKACDTGLAVTNERCQCPAGQVYLNGTGGPCAQACTEATDILVNNHCIPASIVTLVDSMIGTNPTIFFYDAATTSGGTESRSVAMAANFRQMLSDAAKTCDINPLHQTSCEFLANACAISQYEQDAIACKLLDTVLPSQGHIEGFYRDWPAGTVFMRYAQQYEHVMTEQSVTSVFDYKSVLQFYVAAYSYSGEFKGFAQLDDQLQHCGAKNDLKLIWKEFGKNYFGDCSINLSELFTTNQTDFFEFFVADNATQGNRILRPVPVLPVNYRLSGVAYNAQSDPQRFMFFRRLFVYEDSSNDEVYQFAQRITLHVEMKSETKNTIFLPYVIVDYKQGLKSQIQRELSASQFDVEYTMDQGDFWTLFMGIGIVLVILAIAYVIYNSCLTVRINVSDGMNGYVILSIISFIFDGLGTAVFVLVFIFAFYILCFFKWTNHAVFWLAPGGDYTVIYAFIWLALALKLFGIISKVFCQTNTDIVVVDWEDVCKEDKHSAFKRRITIANEWYKLTTLKGYNMQFVLFFVLFVLEGLRCELLSAPIPSSELISTGKSIKVIRFAFTAFIWMMITLIFWLLKRFIYWSYIYNPFRMFEELCVALNVSVIMKSSNTCGFYIHGKNMLPVDGVMTNIDTDSTSPSESDPEIKGAGPGGRLRPTPSMRGGLSVREKLREQTRKKQKKEAKLKKKQQKAREMTNMNDVSSEKKTKKRKHKSKKIEPPDLTNEMLDEKERRWTEYALQEPDQIVTDDEEPKHESENEVQETPEIPTEHQGESETEGKQQHPDLSSGAGNKDEASPDNNINEVPGEDQVSEAAKPEELPPRTDGTASESPRELQATPDQEEDTLAEEKDIEIETDSWSDEKALELSEYSSHSSVVVVSPTPSPDQDKVAVVQPFVNTQKTNIFQIFLEPEFFYQTKRYSDAIEGHLVPKKGQVFDADAPSVVELMDSLNAVWRRFLVSPEFAYRKLIMPMSLAHRFFGLPPPVGDDSVFVAQTSGSYKDSMLYGIEGSLMAFYLLLFSCLEMVTNSPAIGGLVVYIIDVLVVKLFKVRCKRALIKKDLCSHKSLIR